MWDQRYSGSDYAYGTKPNDFLLENVKRLPKRKVLCLAEGEGRNAVFLAEQGYSVTAVDRSQVGLEKAKKLAAERHVSITTVHADLADFEIGMAQWDAIVSVFCHLPPVLRQQVHRQCVAGLRPGAMILLEAYTPEQLNYNTGGPPVANMMMNSTILQQDFKALEMLWLRECVRDIHEGEFHNGKGAVVQLLGKKPGTHTLSGGEQNE